MPTVEEFLERAHVVALPMRVRFRGVDTREALLIDGPAGWGEFAPFMDYGPAEAAAWLAGAVEAAFVGLPTPVARTVRVNATVPAVPPSRVPEILARFPGCDVVKVKVAEPGQQLSDDVARVAAVRKALPGARIRVDANRGWSVAQAVEAARLLGPLDYMEQPCVSLAELAQVRERAGVRVAADESIRRADDPYVVARQRAADVAVVKVAPLGGVRRVCEVAEFMRSRGLGVTVASALDTAVGMNAGCVAATFAGGAAAGLATQEFFVEDVAPPRVISNGEISAEIVAPEQDRLSFLAVDSRRRDWWFSRVCEAWPHLRASDQFL